MLLLFLVLIIIIPNYTYIGSQYIGLLDKDFGFTKTQREVTFHLYKPRSLPENYIQEFRFTPHQKGLISETEAVKAIFGRKMSVALREENISIIILVQEKMPDNFLPEKVAGKLGVDKEVIQPIMVSTGARGQGFSIEKSNIQRVFFVTPDNVLIGFVSPTRTNRQDILKIAESLR